LRQAANRLALPMPQLGVKIYLQVRPGDGREWYPDSSVCAIFKEHFLTINSQQPASKISLAGDRTAGSHFRQTAREPLKICPLVKTAIQTRRRNFKCIGRVNEVFDIQNGAQIVTHFRTIFVSYTTWFVNENSNNRFVVRSGDLTMNQLESVVDGDSLGEPSIRSAIDLGFIAVSKNGRLSTVTQRKSGHSPPDETAVLRASEELYGKDRGEAT
jgi:hypothetical protein